MAKSKRRKKIEERLRKKKGYKPKESPYAIKKRLKRESRKKEREEEDEAQNDRWTDHDL
jgi:hypothetical protein